MVDTFRIEKETREGAFLGACSRRPLLVPSCRACALAGRPAGKISSDVGNISKRGVESVPSFRGHIRGGGQYVGLGCVQQEVMGWVHKRSDVCSVIGALFFWGPRRLALMVEAFSGGVFRVPLSPRLTFWVEGRALACLGV
eukprot:151763-Pelagomonas_calceolata.AAC.2